VTRRVVVRMFRVSIIMVLPRCWADHSAVVENDRVRPPPP
jgi:hypothetical protein